MPHLRRAAHLPPTSSRQRIGLFGGSFDPPHSGHMHVAQTALKRLDLDQVWWFPARGNPLKSAPGEFDTRLAAVQVMTDAHRAMRVSDVEAHAGLTYTIDLVRLVRAHCPNARLVWIMGSDSLENFHQWKDWQALARLIPIAVIARPGSTQATRSSPASPACPGVPQNCYPATTRPPGPISTRRLIRPAPPRCGRGARAYSKFGK